MSEAKAPLAAAVPLAIAALFSLSPGCKSPPPSTLAADAPAGTPATAGAASPAASTATAAPEGARLQLEVAGQDSDALSLIRSKRLEAKASGRVLVVYVGASWCAPCRRMKEEIGAGRLDARLGKISLLAFDADGDLDRLGSAGYTFKFVPYVALPGADGHPIASEEARGKGGEAWRELVPKLEGWQAAGPR